MPRSNYIWNAAAAAILGFVCGAALWLGLHPKPVVPPTAPPVRGVFLRVEPDGRALHLSWNRNSETIRDATNANLYIEDGTHHSQLDLDQRTLSVGQFSYWPETELVKFRLEVISATGTADGTVQFASGAPPPQAPPPEPEAVVAVRRTPPRHSVHVASRAALDEPKPSPFNPPAPPPKAIAPPASEPPVAAVSEPLPKPARTPEPSLSTPPQPVSHSLLGRVVRKIPLIRRLKHKTDQPGGTVSPALRASKGSPD
jgi:hypothetical protein